MPGRHLCTIAQPDTGQQMIVSYSANATGGTIDISIGRIGQDKPEATMQLGASHAVTLHNAIARGIDTLAAIANDMGWPGN